MKKLVMMSLAALTLMTLSSCMNVGFSGNNGKDTTPSQVTQINQVTTMQPFNEVEVTGSFKIIYEQGTDYNVRVEAEEQALKEMTIYVKENELRICKSVSKPTVKLKNVKVYVSSPDLQKIELSGSGTFTAANLIKSNKDLDVEIAGSGKVLLTAVTCHDSDLAIAGSGDIEIGNLEVQEVNCEIAGSGNINLGTMTCKNMEVEIAGSGDVNCDNINAENVKCEIAGSGNVNLKGTVLNQTKEIMGSGKVNIVAPTPKDTIK